MRELNDSSDNSGREVTLMTSVTSRDVSFEKVALMTSVTLRDVGLKEEALLTLVKSCDSNLGKVALMKSVTSQSVIARLVGNVMTSGFICSSRCKRKCRRLKM